MSPELFTLRVASVADTWCTPVGSFLRQVNAGAFSTLAEATLAEATFYRTERDARQAWAYWTKRFSKNGVALEIVRLIVDVDFSRTE